LVTKGFLLVITKLCIRIYKQDRLDFASPTGPSTTLFLNLI